MFWFLSSVCFLSWRIGVEAIAKRGCFSFTGRFSILWIQHQNVYFKKICQTNFLNSSPFRDLKNRFSVKMYLLLSTEIIDWNFEINATKMALIWTRGLRRFFFGAKEEFFRPAFIRLNLVTAFNRFHEPCSLEDLKLKCLEIHNCTATRNRTHISLIWQAFSSRGGDC